VTKDRNALLEPPGEAAVKPFFGEKGWQAPDLTLDFKEQVRKLLSLSD
jgi:hypothetical protein